MRAYLDLVRKILDTGERRPNRTGVDTLAIPGALIEHDMADGFPLLTSKLVPYRLVAAELEFFIRGLTDKQWLQDRGCRIWDEWARQDKIPYGRDEQTKQAMRDERDLGPVYGWQWRHFGALYPDPVDEVGIGSPMHTTGVDQLANVVECLHQNPDSRRMVVSAWNPVDLPKMALPPCHWGFEVLVINGKLHLLWNQRSVDAALGLPFNIASYATLLHLLAREGGFQQGKLVGFLGDTHLYVNHLDGIREQLRRDPRPLPRLVTSHFTCIFDWQHTDTTVEGYHPHPKIPFEIAV